MFGARAVQSAVLNAYPSVALSVLVVWVPVLEADSVGAAQAVAHHISDRRASHFYDGQRRIATAVAASVGGVGNIAWDCYLFYPAGAGWAGVPPTPKQWMHQLGPGTWADPGRYHWGDRLGVELQSAAADLLG